MAKCLAKLYLALPKKRENKCSQELMFYVYILRSSKSKNIYVGYTTNLRIRFNLHNLGKVKSTKEHRPWLLIYYEAYKEKFDATKREKELKSHAAKNELLRRLKNSLE